MSNPLVLIVGAGPTGMTAAIELRRANFDVRIIDKSDHLALHSQALVVQARTLEQFQRYGLAEEAVARGRKLKGAKFFSEGKPIVSFTLDGVQSRYPYALFLPQSETEALLNQHMESLGVKTEREVELTSMAQLDGVRATLRHADGKTEDVEPRWVLGCDGAHSAVRELTRTPFEGGGIDLSFFLGDVEMDGPDTPDDDLAIHVHHGDLIFMGRLSDKWARLIVVLHEEQSARTETSLGLEDFQRAVDRVGVRVKIRSADWMTPFRVSDRQAKHYRVGDIFLAGDASHIHSPVGGQGMNTGIQDVANLAWKLAAVARGADETILNSYEEERGQVGKALLRFTERGLKIATTANPMLEAARDALMPIVSKLHPVQQNAVGFISETGIEYRSSSVVHDAGGEGTLRAGDRVPDFSIRDGMEGATLLGKWNSGRHLALVLNGLAEDRRQIEAALPQAEVTVLGTDQFDGDGQSALGSDRKLLIVRPDGYLGFRGPVARQKEWMDYARQDGLGALSTVQDRGHLQ